MCGIILFAGRNSESRLSPSLDLLRHRGPDSVGFWHGSDFSLGFARLEINGSGKIGQQPYLDRGMVGAVNGEIYNYHQLAVGHDLPTSECDTDILLPLFDFCGPRVIDLLEGFYSAVLIRPEERHVTCLRDHMGKKPLFYGRSKGEVFVTSELKALDAIDWFQIIPTGVSSLNLDTGSLTKLADHRIPKPQGDIVKLLKQAVQKRMPKRKQPVGVFLSGGLDSSLIAALTSQLREDVVYFTLGNEGDLDRSVLGSLVNHLRLKNVHFVPLPSRESIPDLLKSVVYTTESYNPSIISNGLATYLLAREARKIGIKVVLTGEGADELFGGYHSFQENDPWNKIRNQLIEDMHYTELRRLDMSCMAHGIEARCPFLDRELRGLSENLSYRDLYDGGNNKMILRRAFSGTLPDVVLKRGKTSLDVGSGIRREVVRHLSRNGRSERDELRDLWQDCFSFDATSSYFHSYPVFDSAIDKRGALHK